MKKKRLASITPLVPAAAAPATTATPPAAVEMPPLQQQILNLAEWVSALVDVTVGPAAVAKRRDEVRQQKRAAAAKPIGKQKGRSL
jgi:hypothetical protein